MNPTQGFSSAETAPVVPVTESGLNDTAVIVVRRRDHDALVAKVDALTKALKTVSIAHSEGKPCWCNATQLLMKRHAGWCLQATAALALGAGTQEAT